MNFRLRPPRSLASYAHRRLRRELEQLFHAAGVVGLGVVHDDVVDVRRVAHLADVREELVEEFALARLKQRDLVVALDDVRVVGRAGFRIHDDVEHAQVRVLNTDIPHAVDRFDCCH